MRSISSNISYGTTRESVPFAHKDEVTRASAKSTSKQELNNSKKAPHRKTSPRKERNSHPRKERNPHPRKERRIPSEPDPAGSSDPQTSYRTKNYDNSELNHQHIYIYIYI